MDVVYIFFYVDGFGYGYYGVFVVVVGGVGEFGVVYVSLG